MQAAVYVNAWLFEMQKAQAEQTLHAQWQCRWQVSIARSGCLSPVVTSSILCRKWSLQLLRNFVALQLADSPESLS